MLYDDPARIREHVHSYRVSSWDRSGRNHDWVDLYPGKRITLLDETGPGRITHIYWTTVFATLFHYRQLVLRAWWDGEDTPSIECPLGDLFCVPHCTPVPLRSLAATINPGTRALLSWGHNLYWPMPFASSARLELSYEAIPGHPEVSIGLWYHIDLERYEQPLPKDVGTFHAQWRRENPTEVSADVPRDASLGDDANLDGGENYVALEAEGRGQMVGLHLQVDNIAGGWYGEGDDMVFVDGAPGQQWPPTYHGTGSEEIFGGGACPAEAYAGPYTGFHLVENPDFSGKNAMYRWFLADPIRFRKSLVWTIEHGHANNFCNDYTSVAYWYQIEPHAAYPPLLDVAARLPRVPDVVFRAHDAQAELRSSLDRLRSERPDSEELRLAENGYQRGNAALAKGRYGEAASAFESGTKGDS